LVLLTHAHLDHSGALPRMARLGWNGTVLCTRATAALCELLLPDSGHLQEQDADRANRYGYSRHRPALPLYTQADARKALELFRTVEFGEWYPIADGISARYHRAGHILGAASIEVVWKDRTILFSGDIGRYGDAVMKDPAPPPRADYLLVESTYGDRRHEEVDPTAALGDSIERCVNRGGTVVIPAFAVGRAQSLLYHLSRLRASGRLGDTPIYLDSPMAINASGLMCDFMEEHRLSRAECEAACNVAHYVREVEESKALTANVSPKVIISASGMATGGRVLHHLKRFAPDPKNLILFSGFQAAGTRGATLLAGAKTVKIHGEYVAVEAEVANLPMLSAHADSDEIMRWLGSLQQQPRQTFVTHGEPTGSGVLAARITEELGWSCSVPTLGSWNVLV
jgi:metallo-beta-lactamase family protein